MVFLDFQHSMTVEILYWNKQKTKEHIVTPNGCVVSYKPLGMPGEMLDGFIREKVIKISLPKFLHSTTSVNMLLCTVV